MDSEARTYKYLFGPVVSRRLGRSLGVDIVPPKICTMDCVYCEAGRTTRLTTERRPYTPLPAIMAELRAKLAEGVELDYVTITASGEPTLHSELGGIISGIRGLTSAKIAVLTNGSLLHDPAVRQDLCGADLVVPSFDAPTSELLARVNRAAEGITVQSMIDGLRAFRSEFTGQIWLEVLLVAGQSDSEEAVGAVASLVRGIALDRIQLNTVVRPPAYDTALPVPYSRLVELSKLFTPTAEVIAPQMNVGAARATTTVAVTRSDVVAMLRRRPCPLEEISSGLGMTADEVRRHLEILEQSGLVHHVVRDSVVYYQTV